MSSPAVPSPSKGKAKEPATWQTAWCDFYPLLDRPKRPQAWSRSSVIFTAHPSQPLLSARHFSSSKHFSIPSPAPVVSSPASYEPPTIISVASTDDWLFAYFPSRTADGVACLWKRGAQLDNWVVKEWWSLARGSGVVASSWLETPREWAATSSSSFVRLPPRGPMTPVSSPTLLLVTEDHQVCICYFRQFIPTLKMLKCSLITPSVSIEAQASAVDDPPNRLSGIRLCTDAAIGLAYNESTILIATHSRRVPPFIQPNPPQFDSMDLDVGLSQPIYSDAKLPEWETWGEELTIDLCEVQFRFDGSVLGLASNPIHSLNEYHTGMTDLVFVASPPPSPPIADTKRSPSLQKKSETDKGRMHLIASYLDFGDFSANPKSYMVLYSVSRQPRNPGIRPDKSSWIFRQEVVRSFEPEVLTFFAPSVSNAAAPVIYAGVIETSGTIEKGKGKTKLTPVGRIKVLNITNLSDLPEWEMATIQYAAEKAGRELPLRAVLSPNCTLICTISSPLWPSQAAVHLLPKKRKKDTDVTLPSLSVAFASSVLGRKTFADITHLLLSPAASVDEIINTLCHTLEILDTHNNGLAYSSTWDILGMAVEIYKGKAALSHDSTEQRDLTARWQTAHDMCSLAACNIVFEDCKDGDAYELEAVWQLIALCTWIISFTERLMKECVLACDLTKNREAPNEFRTSDAITSAPPYLLQSSPLLHLVHPYSLQNLFAALRHVKRYRTFLGTLSARGENAQIARDVLIDLVDRCGVDLGALDKILEDTTKEFNSVDVRERYQALASCRPTTAMIPFLEKIIDKVTQSTILNKSALFIKPSDLVDGVGRLSMGTHRKETARDIVTKGALQGTLKACIRCGGKSQVSLNLAAPVSIKWRTWERMWTLRCICGGPWASETEH